MCNKNIRTYDYLLILRGLSALAVVFCHYPFQSSKLINVNWFDWLFNPFGYIPVLIFFTLSGHLITLGFIQNRHQANTGIGIKRYYLSRALRILPLYYLSIFICTLIYWQATIQAPGRVLSLLVFWENYKPENGIIFNHVYWTMPVEMLYFILAPGIYLLSAKVIDHFGLIQTVLIILIVFLIFTTFLFRSFEYDNNGIVMTRRDWLFIARFDFFYNLQAFLIGGLSAFFVSRTKKRQLTPYHRLMIWAVSISLITWIIFHSTTYTITALNQSNLASLFLIYGLPPLIGFWLTTIVYLNKFQSYQHHNSFLGALEKLGNISYAMYLFHMPALTITERLIKLQKITISAEMISLIAIALTLIFSSVAYKFFEHPIMKLRHNSRITAPTLNTNERNHEQNLRNY